MQWSWTAFSLHSRCLIDFSITFLLTTAPIHRRNSHLSGGTIIMQILHVIFIWRYRNDTIIQRRRCISNLLGRFKGEREVSASVLWIEPGEVERVRVEVMNEGAERQTVCPRCRKVGDVDVLQQHVRSDWSWSYAVYTERIEWRQNCFIKINLSLTSK